MCVELPYKTPLSLAKYCRVSGCFSLYIRKEHEEAIQLRAYAYEREYLSFLEVLYIIGVLSCVLFYACICIGYTVFFVMGAEYLSKRNYHLHHVKSLALAMGIAVALLVL
jgi:hypothetical protein